MLRRKISKILFFQFLLLFFFSYESNINVAFKRRQSTVSEYLEFVIKLDQTFEYLDNIKISRDISSFFRSRNEETIIRRNSIWFHLESKPYDGKYRRFFSLSCLFYGGNVVVSTRDGASISMVFPRALFNFISPLQRDITGAVDIE